MAEKGRFVFLSLSPCIDFILSFQLSLVLAYIIYVKVNELCLSPLRSKVYIFYSTN